MEMNFSDNEEFDGGFEMGGDDMGNVALKDDIDSSDDESFGAEEKFSSHGDEEDGYDMDDDDVSDYAGSDLSPEEEDLKKKKLLFKLKRLEKQGYKSHQHYTMDSELHDIIAEIETIKKEKNLAQGLKMAKRGLCFATYGIEFLNGKFNNLTKMHLDGWSGTVQDEVDNGEYDDVLEDLYDKYYDKIGDVPPELRLLGMLGASAVQFHAANTVVKTHLGGVAGSEALLKNNPQLKAAINNAVNNTDAGKNIYKDMGMKQPQYTQSKEMDSDDVNDILAEIESDDDLQLNENEPHEITVDW